MVCEVTSETGVDVSDTGLSKSYLLQWLYQGTGAAAADIDGDGFPDIAIAAGGTAPTIVYRNTGDFKFEKLATIDEPAWGVGLVDLDNDGFPDLITTGTAGIHIYQNVGGSSFISRYVMAHPNGFVEGVTPSDIDGDGRLDLFWSAYKLPADSSGLLFNRGNFQFEVAGTDSGISSMGLAWTSVAADFDGDHRQEIYVANDAFVRTTETATIGTLNGAPDRLLRRDSSSDSFADVAPAAGLADPRSTMGAVASDFDDDGDLDLFVTDVGRKQLFINDSHGHFQEQANAFGVTAVRRHNSSCATDSDAWRCLLTGWGGPSSTPTATVSTIFSSPTDRSTNERINRQANSAVHPGTALRKFGPAWVA